MTGMKIPGLSFSLKRAVGITGLRHKTEYLNLNI